MVLGMAAIALAPETRGRGAVPPRPVRIDTVRGGYLVYPTAWREAKSARPGWKSVEIDAVVGNQGPDASDLVVLMTGGLARILTAQGFTYPLFADECDGCFSPLPAGFATLLTFAAEIPAVANRYYLVDDPRDAKNRLRNGTSFDKRSVVRKAWRWMRTYAKPSSSVLRVPRQAIYRFVGEQRLRGPFQSAPSVRATQCLTIRYTNLSGKNQPVAVAGKENLIVILPSLRAVTATEATDLSLEGSILSRCSLDDQNFRAAEVPPGVTIARPFLISVEGTETVYDLPRGPLDLRDVLVVLHYEDQPDPNFRGDWKHYIWRTK